MHGKLKAIQAFRFPRKGLRAPSSTIPRRPSLFRQLLSETTKPITLHHHRNATGRGEDGRLGKRKAALRRQGRSQGQRLFIPKPTPQI